MIDQRFGRLVVVAREASAGGHVMWRCRCDCGGEKIVRGSALRRGETASCGCKLREVAHAHLPVATAASALARKKPSAPPQQVRKLPVLKLALSGYSAAEAAAIEAALAAGKVTRIENGEWPDAGRPEVVKFKSSHQRAILKAAR